MDSPQWYIMEFLMLSESKEQISFMSIEQGIQGPKWAALSAPAAVNQYFDH